MGELGEQVDDDGEQHKENDDVGVFEVGVHDFAEPRGDARRVAAHRRRNRQGRRGDPEHMPVDAVAGALIEIKERPAFQPHYAKGDEHNGNRGEEVELSEDAKDVGAAHHQVGEEHQPHEHDQRGPGDLLGGIQLQIAAHGFQIGFGQIAELAHIRLEHILHDKEVGHNKKDTQRDSGRHERQIVHGVLSAGRSLQRSDGQNAHVPPRLAAEREDGRYGDPRQQVGRIAIPLLIADFIEHTVHQVPYEKHDRVSVHEEAHHEGSQQNHKGEAPRLPRQPFPA